MGIQGLLPLLKDIQKKVSVSDFNGKSVGIDGYCWLHKGVYGCAKDVVEGRKTALYINYVLRRINMLLNYNIKPVMVFDGGYLPAKASKEKERRRLREENLKKAKSLLRSGHSSQANEYFQRCVEITPAMATEVIQACREKNVLCVVAPYEADAQLAYLEMQGITDFTISEDSDLLIYGCKRVLFKMNSDGDGIFINLDELNKVKTVALESFTMEKFRHMCILSGCDYLPSIKGLGLYKAHKYLRKSTNVYKAIQLIQQENKLKVPEGYADDFRKTDAVFKYQSVFDPKRKKIVRLNEVSETENVTEEDLRYAGPDIDEAKALKIALGNVDPISGDTLGSFDGFVNHVQTKKPSGYNQTSFEKQSKHRDPNLRYSLDDAASDVESTDTLLEDSYLVKSTLPGSTSEGDKGELSPPERGLRNIHLCAKEDTQRHSSSGLLYKEKSHSGPNLSRFGHHSVFVKRKQSKLKNPFRVCEDVTVEESEGHKSRYFNSQDSSHERESDLRNRNESLLTKSDETCEVDGFDERSLSQYGGSSPDSKRVKLSFVDYLDSHSEASLQHETSKRLGLDGSCCQKDDDAETSSSDIAKSCSITDEPSFDLSKGKLENRSPQIKERNLDDTNYNQTTCELRTCSNDGMTTTNAENVGCSVEAMPPLPSFSFSFVNNDSRTDSSRFRSDKLSGRLSLFKYNKGRTVISLNEGTDEKENNTSSQSMASTGDEEKASSLHLQTRSFSEPILRRQSSSKPPTLLGKCKSIGLSKRSKSSLERVREKDSKLKQLKIGFERFSYTRRKLE